MHNMFGKLLVTFFVFTLVFSIFGQADTITTSTQDRVPIKPQPPACEKGDKGTCQAVCNVARNGDGTPNPAGCIEAFNALGQGTVCRVDQVTVLVGCDLPSAEQCTASGNRQGVWCSCYYLCQDLPQPKER